MAKKSDSLNDLLAKSFTAPPVKPAGSLSPPPSPPPTPAASPTKAPRKAVEPSQHIEETKRGGEPTHQAEDRSGAARMASKDASPTSAPPAPDFDGVKKTTVSFYAAEQAQVDQILDLLIKSRRHRGGFSDAIKIALRLCPMDADQIGRAWDTARASDKRTQRGKS